MHPIPLFNKNLYPNRNQTQNKNRYKADKLQLYSDFPIYSNSGAVSLIYAIHSIFLCLFVATFFILSCSIPLKANFESQNRAIFFYAFHPNIFKIASTSSSPNILVFTFIRIQQNHFSHKTFTVSVSKSIQFCFQI